MASFQEIKSLAHCGVNLIVSGGSIVLPELIELAKIAKEHNSKLTVTDTSTMPEKWLMEIAQLGGPSLTFDFSQD